MPPSDLITCPGCGIEVAGPQAEPPKGFNASGECYNLFNELTFYTLSLGYGDFIHQTAIDSYEAQHVGSQTKNITAVFGLIGLYLALERGYTGRKVQQAHMLLASKNKVWPRFDAPSINWQLTVADVIQAPQGAQRDQCIMDWAGSVWGGWRAQRDAVIALVAAYLD